MSRLHIHPERHAVARIGWLRAAVLGANDGIVSTGSLIVGVAASGTDRSGILVAGIAALVAAHAADDKKGYVTAATALQQEFGKDSSIMFLIERLNETEKGESYVLS